MPPSSRLRRADGKLVGSDEMDRWSAPHSPAVMPMIPSLDG